jgi:peptide chain release factor 1
LNLQQHFQNLERHYHQLIDEMNAPETQSQPERFQRLRREHARLTPILEHYHHYERVLKDLAQAKELINGTDVDLRKMAEEEIKTLEPEFKKLEAQLQIDILPPDPNADRNLILEIRAGTGGEEAALFAGDLLRMYTRYAENNGWKVEPLDASLAERGGYKEVIVQISGNDVWSHFKYESGVHRVQRVPNTEASGRVHTSTATVAVLAEAEDVDIQVRTEDLRIDTYRAHGAGGQHINKTESAIRITHLPTNLVVTCQDQRSQIKNKEKAMKMLKSRLLHAQQEKQAAEMSQNRKSQVGTGERSEKIRTYNYPQDRITDHRINENFHNLPGMMEGDLQKMVELLQKDEQSRQLAELTRAASTGEALFQ